VVVRGHGPILVRAAQQRSAVAHRRLHNSATAAAVAALFDEESMVGSVRAVLWSQGTAGRSVTFTVAFNSQAITKR
jgi:hypothetical protein